MDSDTSTDAEREGERDSDRDGRPVSRRGLLAAGATASVVGLAGCYLTQSNGPPSSNESTPANGTGNPSTETTHSGGERTEADLPVTLPPHAQPFSSVVDVVADGGADPTGKKSVVPVLRDHLGPDTLFYFPPGTYLMDGTWEVPRFERIALAGQDATIRPTDGATNYLVALGRPATASTAFVQGLTFDFTAPDTAPRPLQVRVKDRLVVRDITVHGSSGTTRFDVTSPTGVGNVERLSLADGGGTPNDVGCLVGPESQGTLTFTDCTIAGFGNNGLYASSAKGPVHVVGGSYRNNGIASVRVSSPCRVSGVHVRCDRAPAGFRNMRGIRLRNGDGAIVEDCTVEMLDVTYSEGGVVVEAEMAGATIENTDVVTTANSVPGINVKSPVPELASTDTAVTCRNVQISGSATGGNAITVVDRDNCQFDGLCVRQRGPNRDGFLLRRASNTRLSNVGIDVTGTPIVLEQSSVHRDGVTVGPQATCGTPSTTEQ